jgi:hypothetical protein
MGYSKRVRLTRSDDLSELLELRSADLDIADFEQTGEKLSGQAGQYLLPVYCVLACREIGLRPKACYVPSPRSLRSRR